MVGYTPSLSTAVWVGTTEGTKPLENESGSAVYGSGLPSDIWKSTMDGALGGHRQRVVPEARPRSAAMRACRRRRHRRRPLRRRRRRRRSFSRRSKWRRASRSRSARRPPCLSFLRRRSDPRQGRRECRRLDLLRPRDRAGTGNRLARRAGRAPRVRRLGRPMLLRRLGRPMTGAALTTATCPAAPTRSARRCPG